MKKTKLWLIGVMSAVTAAAFSMCAFAADSSLDPLGWQKNDRGWWYATDCKASTWYSDGWFWINANDDDAAECYYFDKDGYLLTDTTTPDGYTVNSNGQWTVNGTVQTKYAGIDKWGWFKTDIVKDRTGYVTYDGLTLYKIENGGYDENGVSVTAMDMLANTPEENDAKYTRVKGSQSEEAPYIRHYANGFAMVYGSLGGPQTSVGIPTTINEDLSLLYKYYKAGTDPDDFSKELKAMGYVSNSNGSYGWVDVAQGAGLTFDDNSITLDKLTQSH